MTKCKICKSVLKISGFDSYDTFFVCIGNDSNHRYLKSVGEGENGQHNFYECIIILQENFDYVFDCTNSYIWNAARVEKSKFDIYSDGLKESKCWNSFEIGEIKNFNSQNLIAKMDTLLAFE
jgi:hypothetical protein